MTQVTGVNTAKQILDCLVHRACRGGCEIDAFTTTRALSRKRLPHAFTADAPVRTVHLHSDEDGIREGDLAVPTVENFVQSRAQFREPLRCPRLEAIPVVLQ